MRDYRGKRKDTGEWVFGFFVAEPSGVYCVAETPLGGLLPKKVREETIGQCSGIFTTEEIEGGDTECTFIYEGDIVEPVLLDGTHKGFSWGKQVVVFDRGAFCLKDRRGQITPMCNYAESVQFRVRGNVWDNPELLEGVDDA